MEIYKKSFKNIDLQFVEMYWFKSEYSKKYLEMSYLKEHNMVIMNLNDKIPIWIEYEKIPLYEFIFNNSLFEKLFDENNLKDCKESFNEQYSKDYEELKKEENDEMKKLFFIIKKELLEIMETH